MKSSRETAIEAMMDNHMVVYEFIRAHVGDLIGEGAFRYVFQDPFHRDLVIKIDMSDQNANVVEFDLWNTIKLIPDLAKWFCPVVRMTPCGRVLIMKKADVEAPLSRYPDKIPDFMQDVKKSNFGFYKGNFVCVDYGYNLLYVTGEKYKMVKATW